MMLLASTFLGTEDQTVSYLKPFTFILSYRTVISPLRFQATATVLFACNFFYSQIFSNFYACIRLHFFSNVLFRQKVGNAVVF